MLLYHSLLDKIVIEAGQQRNAKEGEEPGSHHGNAEQQAERYDQKGPSTKWLRGSLVHDENAEEDCLKCEFEQPEQQQSHDKEESDQK